jgi:hypothetical protein
MRHKSPEGRLPTSAVLDRRAQALPVPLGGLRPVRRQPSALLRTWRRHQSAALLAVAATATGGAVWLAATPRSFTVEANASEVRVDGAVLTASSHGTGGIRVFSGQASLALTPSKSGMVRGAAVMVWKGMVTTGQCVLHLGPLSATETCRFRNGAVELTSTDAFDVASRVWQRRYGDGIDITVTVPKGSDLIPIPFPLGR